ncbi:MAG: hypothetical protein AAF530_19255 [Pseudomonadota bacterium]
MAERSVRPEDVLPDQEDFKTIKGVRVRKGTIFAAMQNMEILDSGTPEEKSAAKATIKELAPGLVALGMRRHFICRNPEVQQILDEAAKDLGL